MAAARADRGDEYHPIADTHLRLSLLGLDSMVTVTYPLEGINQGYRDLRDGRNIRGVLMI